MSALLKELQRKTAEINDIKAKLVEELRPKFTEIFSGLFVKYPDLLGVRWTQYTPHFNDGDACEFGVHELCIKHKGVKGDCDEDDDDFGWTWDLPSDYAFDRKWLKEEYDSEKYVTRRKEESASFSSEDAYLEFIKDLKAVNAEVQGIPEDVMEDLFGDHVQVTVTREGMEVEGYDHD